VKVGDLVKYTDPPRFAPGMGVILGFEERSPGVYVRWLSDFSVTLELDTMLEALSESR
jgi:hypothetical protein